MKKFLILIICIVIVISGLAYYYFFLRKNDNTLEKYRIVDVKLKEDLTTPFLSEVDTLNYIESINGFLLSKTDIDTTTIGPKTVTIKYMNYQGFIIEYTYVIEVVDKIPPKAFINGTYYVKQNASPNFYKNIFCGDNYTNKPNCYFEGEYDLTTLGTYPVVFKAVDESGNEFSKNVNLVVYKPKESSENKETTPTKTYYSDVIKEYKTDKTKIGIDVSKWQGDIDFDKIKEAGVEFIIIRIGGTRGTRGEYFVDEKFKRNMEEAKRVGIDIGLYFYSYASSREEAINDAKWIIEQIKDYDIDLPIAFDWENWGSFNNYNVSFYEITMIAKAFLDTLSNAGYEGLLYSSKTYLNEIWMDTGYDVWLAHYTNKTNYKGDYTYWQMCSDGKIDGIKGSVDIDIMYLDK